MSHIKTLAFLTTLVLAFAALAAHAEVTGQKRAQAAGRDLLGAPAPMLVLKTIDGEECFAAAIGRSRISVTVV